MFETLDALHQIIDNAQNNREIQTNKEISFLQAYGRDLNEARDYCKRYKMSDKKNTRDIDSAWDKYYSVFKRIHKQLQQMKESQYKV